MTPKQYELLCFIKSSIADNGYSPSFDEMAAHCGIVKSGVARLVDALEDQHLIRRAHYRARSIELVPMRGRPGAVIIDELAGFETGALLDELRSRGLSVAVQP